MDAIGGLGVWLAPFLAALGRKTRRAWAPLYVQGLLGPDEGRACGRWRNGLACRGTTRCTTS